MVNLLMYLPERSSSSSAPKSLCCELNSINISTSALCKRNILSNHIYKIENILYIHK